MRKGKLIIEKKTTFKIGDRCFDSLGKIPLIITSTEKDDIFGEDMMTGNPVKIKADVIFVMRIQDTIEENAIFDVAIEQQSYLFSSESKDMLRFMTRNNHLTGFKDAIVLAKNIKMTEIVGYVAPICDFYGQYVASQKASNEPAKNFSDWYFNISI